MTIVDAVNKMLAARDRGVEACTMSEDDFEDLFRDKPDHVEVHRATGIFSELGVLGYCLGITIFDADRWAEFPLKYKDFVEVPNASVRSIA